MVVKYKDKWLFMICLAWAMLWTFYALGNKGWIPNIGCLVGLAAIAGCVPVSLCAVVFFVISLLRKQFSVGAGASLLVIAYAFVFSFVLLPTKPTQICHVPETNEVIRLYFYENGFVITSVTYRITFQDGATLEKTIVKIQSAPIVKRVECQKDGVVLMNYQGAYMLLPLQSIREDLIHKPLYFSYGSLESLEYQDQVRSWGVTIPTPTPVK